MVDQHDTLTFTITYGSFTYQDTVIPDDQKAATEVARAIANFAFKQVSKLTRGPEDRG